VGSVLAGSTAVKKAVRESWHTTAKATLETTVHDHRSDD